MPSANRSAGYGTPCSRRDSLRLCDASEFLTPSVPATSLAQIVSPWLCEAMATTYLSWYLHSEGALWKNTALFSDPNVEARPGVFSEYLLQPQLIGSIRSPSLRAGQRSSIGQCRLIRRGSVEALREVDLQYMAAYVRAVAPFQLGENAPDVHGCFSSQSFWKAGSTRKGSHIGSSLESAGVIGVRRSFAMIWIEKIF